ncbi:putative permease YjgP/YjgQ family protein [Stieleria neptunia]|uniref:Putative permease YjgP/YjgQ family protein n=1 Tax=Stieleria neptunia TaxID=2527979 RepID=A0A518HSC3_9BACT|nr:LptF/LptG family permease [Stieleria neptunia]QDV43688.1 putative permease YjgP/YjgQ family protein [Stieleria neptunia]
MTQIDRYILGLFFRTFLVCFASLSGIFVVFHAFQNMNDLAELAESRGVGISRVMWYYYGPYMLLLFDWTGAIIALMSLLFVVGWLRRTGELTATLAAGVSHGRIFRAMVCAALAIVLVQLASRELLLPTMRDALSMKSKDLSGDAPQPILPSYDKISGILLEGHSIRPRSKEIHQPNFRLDVEYAGFGEAIVSASARWLPADENHDEGYLMQDVFNPPAIDSIASARRDGRLVLMTAHDQPWLAPGQCFVVTPVNAEILQTDQSSTRLCSSLQLLERLRNPAVHNSMATRVLLHERIMRVPLDFSLFLLGLPLVVNRRGRNLFMMIGAAIGTVMLFFALKTAGSAMGGGGYLLSPAVAAWMPFLVLGPIAYVRLREVETV